MNTIKILDTTLRDGEQTPGMSLTAKEKLNIAKCLLTEVKVDIIEAASALVSADMSMCGIESVVPFDDVVSAMNEIGQMMPCEIKETSEGGLATTKTGQKFKLWLKKQK